MVLGKYEHLLEPGEGKIALTCDDWVARDGLR